MIAVDVRSLQDPRARGVSHYLSPLLTELCRDQGDGLRLFSSGSRPAPSFPARQIHLNIPNKLVNAGMRFFGTPVIDGITGCSTVWMPNLNFWSVDASTKLVVTVHDLSFLIEPAWYSPRERLWHRAIGAKQLLRRADALITLSKHTKQELVDVLDIDEKKIHVIPPGIPLSFRGVAEESQPSNSEIPRLRFGMTEPYILFIGALERRKNVVRAIQAFELAADKLSQHAVFGKLNFILAGAPGAGYDEIRFRIKDLRFKDRVHIAGPVLPEEKSKLLAGASAFFFPSLYEGFGFPPLEAMAHGVPVVASSVGALPETLGNAALMFDPFDVGALAEGLASACTDEALRKTLIARGHERVKRFSWQEAARETMKVLCSM